MPSSSLWQGITTLMRFPRYMRISFVLLRSVLARRGRGLGAAPGERRHLGLPPRQLAPVFSHLETGPLLQDGRHHARVEEDVHREEALVGAEALRLPDELPRRLRLLGEPDAREVVTMLAHVAELAVDEQLARVHVPIREQCAAEVPAVAGDLVRVLALDLRDQVVPHDPLRVDEVREGEMIVAAERARLVLPLHVVGVPLVLLDVEELRERLLRAAPREERE